MTRPRREKKKEFKQFRRRRRRPCVFCVEKQVLDYKDVDFVRRFMTERGKIAPRRSSGCCAKHQRMVAREVKKARQVGFVPFTVE